MVIPVRPSISTPSYASR